MGAGAFLMTHLRGGLWAQSDRIDRISIFHTTDLHGNILPTTNYDGVSDLGGLARCATRLKQWRRLYPHNLTIDVGDLYQGTDVSLRTDGRIMIDCLNHLNFDAWVIGNHELDWGIETVHQAVAASNMPVLGGNLSLHNSRVWIKSERERSTLLPYLMREINGYRIAIIGLTTPNMANWFLPDLTTGFAAFDPVPVMRSVMREIRGQKPDAIILATHMGVRPWSREDDAANRLFAISAAFPQIDAIIAGHTHRDQPERKVNTVVYTQANYFGIHLGHLELHFDRQSRKLEAIRPATELMDSRYGLDPEVIALTRDSIEASAEHIGTPVGTLAETLEFASRPGQPSAYERLIGSALVEGLRKRGIAVDAAIHGLLFTDKPLEAGQKTVADMWQVIPFENFVVTAEVTIAQLKVMMTEMFRNRNHRSLMGLFAVIEGAGEALKVAAIQRQDGTLIPDNERVRIVINSYDAASGGSRFPNTRDILTEARSKRTMHRLQSRALLIEYFQNNSLVSIAGLI
jgi:2',3'-cyclic-nucleotide 2'-phosphodiesterase (5'-nucleotidase family)